MKNKPTLPWIPFVLGVAWETTVWVIIIVVIGKLIR